jgi:hypothetical protein
MVPNVTYYPVVGVDGKIIYIFKLSQGSFQAPWEAEEIAAKARSALKAGDYVPQIVIMEGEPAGDPMLFGPHACVSYIRSILPRLANRAWPPFVLD